MQPFRSGRRAAWLTDIAQRSVRTPLPADLHRWLEGVATRARPLVWHQRAWRWARRHPAVATLSSLVAAALVLIVVGSLWFAPSLQVKNAEIVTGLLVATGPSTGAGKFRADLSTATFRASRRQHGRPGYVMRSPAVGLLVTGSKSEARVCCLPAAACKPELTAASAMDQIGSRQAVFASSDAGEERRVEPRIDAPLAHITA